MKKVMEQDVDLVHQQTLPLWTLRFYVSGNLKINFSLAYERLVCKAPAEYKPLTSGSLPQDVPLSIALTGDENDPWTETSHKFRFYEQPILAKCDPCEVEVGAIREIFVLADESSQFFEPLPSVSRSGLDEEAEEKSMVSVASSLGGITCQFGRFGET